MRAAGALVLVVVAASARAQPVADGGLEVVELPGVAAAVEAADLNSGEGYSPSEESAHETLRLTGYVDVGFARAFGSGSSFAPGDDRLPLDYGNDAFAPAVNSRGDVASTDTQGRFTNGFLPRSVGIGGRASFLLNTASVDVRFTPRQFPLFVFVRLQAMPRFLPGGDATRVELQQAFGRLTPLSSAELAISVGRFDSVFGIEYLENEANLRTGITPSLIARYTTGHSLGAKVFYRVQVPAAWSSFSVNAAATNSGSRIEALVGPDASLVGVPVGTARLGYELSPPRFQLKLGVSGLFGARNDARSPGAQQWAVGADLRITFEGLSLSAEALRLVDEKAPGLKVTGLEGTRELATGFDVWGGWVRLAYTLPWKSEVVTGFTLYGRYDRRHGTFAGFPTLVTDRFTAGARLDLWDALAVKAEGLFNRELSGAPSVDNDVFTSSVVFTY